VKLLVGARVLPSWRRAIAIVQPETVLRWHRAGFRYTRWYVASGASIRDLMHTAVCNMIVCMNVDRLSITLDPRLGAAARKAAKRAKVSLSTWIAEATADRVRNELLGEALDRWEADEGALTQQELDRAAEALGLSRRRKARRA